MEYLKLPMTNGLNVTDSADAQGGYMVTQLQNYAVLPGGGYQTVYGRSQLGGEVPGTDAIRVLFWYNEKLYAVRDDDVVTTQVYIYEWTGATWSQITPAIGASADSDEWDVAIGNIDGTERVFLTTGVERFVHFDGTTPVGVLTGMSPDTPNHVAVHKKRLFLSFGPSLQYSALGDMSQATGWSPVTGAGELLVRGDITALKPLVGNTLGIWTETGFYTLTGNGPDDWVVSNAQPLNEYGIEIGARARTVQSLGNRTFFYGRRGVLELSTAREFGDFNDTTISQPVEQILRFKEDDNKPFNLSAISRNTNRYMLFNASGDGLVLTLQGTQVVGWSTLDGFGLPTAITTTNPISGAEKVYFGDSTGDVYELFDRDEKAFGGIPVAPNGKLLIPSFGRGNPRIEIHGVTVDIRVLPIDLTWDPPELKVKIHNDSLLPLEWDSEGIEIPVEYGGTFRYARFYRGYYKCHVTCSSTELAFVSNSLTDQPYVIDSATIAYTPAGEDYQV